MSVVVVEVATPEVVPDAPLAKPAEPAPLVPLPESDVVVDVVVLELVKALVEVELPAV